MAIAARFFHCVTMLLIFGPSLSTTQTASFWNEQGKESIKRALEVTKPNRNVAKNVIVFVGDGMDITTITAARILKGQLKGGTGEEATISWERFPHVALSKTYNTDMQVADSAGTATAMFTGVKTKYSLIGLDGTIERDVCPGNDDANLESFLVSAQREGKSTGFVTTTSVTHATPAALYASSASRRWEDDSAIPESEAAKGCTDIADQLLTKGRDIQVILGGGRRYFLSNSTHDPEYTNKTGNRQDGRNLIEEWLQLHDEYNAEYIWNDADFSDVDSAQVDYLLGLFEPSHMQYEQERSTDEAGEPSIEEMTEKAIQILSKNDQGYILMIEGGRIDHGHHRTKAQRALTDTLALDDAVTKAISMVNIEDTLVVVTADHAHSMTQTGYSSRGNSIFGLSDQVMGLDNIPFSTLSYANGPGAVEEMKSINETGHRRNLTEKETSHYDFVAPALVATKSEHHGGQDVGIFAWGPMAHLFHGVQEQSYIAHAVRYAACLDKYSDCSGRGNMTNRLHLSIGILVATFLFVSLN